MKYGTTLMVLGIINIVVIFSGFPTSWKKALVAVSSLLIIAVGWVLRTLYKKRMMRMEMEKREIESEFKDEVQDVANEMVADEIDALTHEKV